jgi:hypothetical protein
MAFGMRPGLKQARAALTGGRGREGGTARTAVGMAELPLDIAIEMVVAVDASA